MITQKLSVLGSTGSIGRQTLEVCDELHISVSALTGGTNVSLMEQQCLKYKPEIAVMADSAAAEELRCRLIGTGIRVLSGMEGVITAAELPESDTVLVAVVGMAGLLPTLAAIRSGKRIALANKETLVCGGELVMEAARQHRAEIIPVDSEHSAIFQCLMGCESKAEVERLLITCSGGPFWGMNREQVARMRAADALKHPNWKMGPKITIDSATLMNKGLEVIEAMRLYDMPVEQVIPVIHRQSIVHSLVEFRDGAVLAQLGVPDMRIPIQLALTYPNRVPGPSNRLNLLTCGPLSFSQPDEEAFPCLALAKAAAERGGNACAVLNGANEKAVELFLKDAISFYDISDCVEEALSCVSYVAHPAIEDVLEADRLSREIVVKHFGESRILRV